MAKRAAKKANPFGGKQATPFGQAAKAKAVAKKAKKAK